MRHYRRAQEAEELSRAQRQRANRSVGYYFDHDGCMVLKARLPAEAGALLIKASTAVEELPGGDSPKPNPPLAKLNLPEARPDIRQRRADALALLAESFMKHGTEEMNGGDATRSSFTFPRKRALRQTKWRSAR